MVGNEDKAVRAAWHIFAGRPFPPGHGQALAHAVSLYEDLGLVIGRDGSKIVSQSIVYVLKRSGPPWGFLIQGQPEQVEYFSKCLCPIQKVNYFYGFVKGFGVMALMVDDQDIPALNMISTCGWVAQAMIRIQRRFRNKANCTSIQRRKLLPTMIMGEQAIAWTVASYLPWQS